MTTTKQKLTLSDETMLEAIYEFIGKNIPDHTDHRLLQEFVKQAVADKVAIEITRNSRQKGDKNG